MFDLSKCTACPRACGTNRYINKGLCGEGHMIRAARAALHFWEEPCISGTRGSGTVFFSGCCLRCVFCQNYAISNDGFGHEVTIKRLQDIFIELEQSGAHNINLVNPTHFAPQIFEALSGISLSIPVVYNSGGYDSVDTLRMLEGLIDIYLPDMKYYDPVISNKYSGAPDYFEKARAAVLEMYRQTGSAVLDSDGMMKRGVIIRHLIMPGLTNQSLQIIEWIKNNLPSDIYISIMSQYVPMGDAGKYSTINRRITKKEYSRVLNRLRTLEFENGFIQDMESADGFFVPTFDLSGITT